MIDMEDKKNIKQDLKGKKDELKAAHKRRQKEYYIIPGLVAAVVFLTYIESHISVISGDIPVATSILVLGLININILLILGLVFLVLRNTAKLYFERKNKVLGSSLMTKLVASFVALTIIPTFLLFFVVIGFINKSIDSWFDIKVEDSLKESLAIAQDYYQERSDKIVRTAKNMALSVTEDNAVLSDITLKETIDAKLADNDLASIEVFNNEGQRVAYTISDKVTMQMVPEIDVTDIDKALAGEASGFVDTIEDGDVVRGVAPIFAESEGVISVAGVVVVSYYIPRSLARKMKQISNSYEGYKQLQLQKNPVKTIYFMILLIIILLIVFISIMIGRYLAKGITDPIQELAEGTHAIASGDLDYRINVESKDEIGLLVKSFNRMTEDLKSGKTGLESANRSLRQTNLELDRRRSYIETVMGSIPAGVISIDKGGRITSINKVAEEILGVERTRVLDSNYKEVLREEEREFLKEMIREMSDLGAQSIERQMKVQVSDTVMTVLVDLNALKDEKGEYIGMVAVLDDLTHLIKTQRMAAWKEVARRIAHEIKNPLTPIQLSAQRLRKKYLDVLGPEEKVFDECTQTIVRQVEELKVLVNEFSSFARMPTANPAPNNLNELVGETVSLYKTGHGNIKFVLASDKDMPVVDLDRDQIKRVLINLIDNAVSATEEENGDNGGQVTVTTRFDKELKFACIDIVDNGCGISPEDKQRIFEPYFSKKKSGTGLGLAIVNNIISDHSGYIRVRDHDPKGTKFTIELPIKAVTI